jgi:DNA-binding transcriptional MerR regulator
MDAERDASFPLIESVPAGEGSAAPFGSNDRSIGEMAEAFGLTQRALRFYENKGLLAPRREGAARLYSAADCERLAQVLKAKQLGFTLIEIRQMLAAGKPATAGALNISRRQCFDQIQHLEQRKREIDAALAELRRVYSSFYARMVGAADEPQSA